jgi:hypothetical protein
MKICITVVLLLLISLTSNAQSLDGSWKGKMSGSNGDMELVFTFKVNADSLIGNVKSSMGILPIENGKVNGNKFSFDVNVNGQAIHHTGILDSGMVKLNVPWSGQPIVLSRVNGESKIDGKWIGNVNGPQGQMELTFTFKVEEDTLTGTDSSSVGVIGLTNGKVNGNDFSFDVDLQGMQISHKCQYLPSDTIDVKANVQDQEIDMKLTRAIQ